jgi:low temperature requirement protein LtrA
MPANVMSWYRPMAGRSTGEEHRTATPLELFFDLCFVVAVALAAERLHHAVAENHIGHGLVGYLTVFFAVWWAWMNFTWFASAYDTDDGVYRLTTLVQIAGVLVLAAGVPRAFDNTDFTVITAGYVLMRLAMVGQWLRAAHGDPARRPCALRYAAGITIVQAGWVARLALPAGTAIPSFLVLAAAELAVPLWAERAPATPWHREHIAERFGLFTLIVLGESVLAATTAVQSALDGARGHGTRDLLSLAGAGVVVVFSMWWLYFDTPAHDLLTSVRMAFAWGYGHLAIFASVAAVGAGLQVNVDYALHVAHIGPATAGAAIAVPVALYLVSVWALQVCPHQRGLLAAAFPVAAVLVLATPFMPAPVHAMAAVLAVLVAVTTATASHRATARRKPAAG